MADIQLTLITGAVIFILCAAVGIVAGAINLIRNNT